MSNLLKTSFVFCAAFPVMLFALLFIFQPPDVSSYSAIIQENKLFMNSSNVYEIASKGILWLIGQIFSDVMVPLIFSCAFVLLLCVHLDTVLVRKIYLVLILGIYFGENFLFNQIRMVYGLPFFSLWLIYQDKKYAWFYLVIAVFFHMAFLLPLLLYFASSRKIFLFMALTILGSSFYLSEIIEFASILQKVRTYAIIEGQSTFIILRMSILLLFVLFLKKGSIRLYNNQLFRMYLLTFLSVIVLYDYLPVIFGRMSSLIVLTEPFLITQLTNQKYAYILYAVVLIILGGINLWLRY